jgi:pullulanase/glycogen debranching enzyme
LYLYKKSDDTVAYEEIEMIADDNMVWEAELTGNLNGVYYDFTVHGSNDPGNHFYESMPKHISDPYARVNMDSWGKSMVWERTLPATPLINGIPRMEDVIAYEVHVQDFTDLLPVPNTEKGTFPAMHKSGLKNINGHKIGFDYLKDLGINTLHLMPVQEFMHHPDDLWKKSFQDDPFMIENGVADENYHWGYRTSHCFAIENKFRKKGTAPGEERNQFRDLVQSYHDAGIAVIIDIVPNHTAEDMDGNWFFHFNVLDKLYYYRTKDLDHIGEYGNEVKTENRPMVQKWLIDQCLHFINEFGIDGFRIDLAGQIDKQTLIKLKEAIGHDKILYGEPWIASNDPAYEDNPDWDWYKADAPITFFQDDARNAFKGPPSNPTDPYKDRGFAGGNEDDRSDVIRGLTNTFPDDHTTTDGINYLDIHDNWVLADQFAIHNWDGRFGVDEDAVKIAATLLFTSMGPLVLNGGTEHLRSKGSAKLQEVVKTMTNGVNLYFHGKRDTYNMRKANQFKWEKIGLGKTDENPVNHKDMYDFWKGLIALRKSDLGKVFRQNFATPAGYYNFLLPKDHTLLGYVIDKKIMVAVNVSDSAKIFPDVKLPKGNWIPIGDNEEINVEGIAGSEQIEVQKGNIFALSIGPKSLIIWKKEE